MQAGSTGVAPCTNSMPWRVHSVRWQNPHAELVLELQSPLTLPSDLAPLTRMQAWNVTPLKVGDAMGVLGFAFQEEKGAAILRAEYLFVGAKAYGLRSSPA